MGQRNILEALRIFWITLERKENIYQIFFRCSKVCSIEMRNIQFSSVAQSCPLFVTPWIAARQASLSITNSLSSIRLTSIESVMPSSHLILYRPLLLLPPVPPSISLFQWVNSSHKVAKVLEFQLQHHSFQRNPRADLLQNGLVGSPCSPFWRRSALGFLWKEWCWSWNSSTLATSCKELTHWKRP